VSRQQTSPTAAGRSPLGDAYAAWFDAHSRCAHALRDWRSATTAGREAAYHVYLAELDLEEAAARDLARVHMTERVAA
jgi:hypothetical protein